MKFKTVIILSLFFWNFYTPGWGKETKTELVIFKEFLDAGTLFQKGRTCDEVFPVKEGKNLSDLREMRNYFCEGEYSLTLDGPPGTTITLYGQFFYGKARGFLTLTKTDDRQVWVWDLESFPDGHWAVSEANKNTGAYEAFFHAAPNFKMNLGSVKWNEIP